MATATLAAAAGALAASTIPNLLSSVLLDDYVNSTGARCLDGTPARYWIQRNPASTKWAIHFMGGGWCESIEDCAARAYAPTCYIGSSNPKCFLDTPGNSPPGISYNETMDITDIPSILGARWAGGLLINDPTRNAFSPDWNHVELHYCSGDGHVGNNEEPAYVTYNGTAGLPLYWRGGRNAAAMFDSLKRTADFDSATEVVLSGDSAGGLATFSWADRLAGMLPGARVVVAPDSGYFYTSGGNYPQWNASLHWVASNGNATAFLNAVCVEGEQAAGRDPLRCIFPEVVSPYMTTPTFIMNSRFDPALDSISGGENGQNVSNVNRLGDRLVQLVNETVLGGANKNAAINAAFLTSCHQHCGQWATNQTGYFPDAYVVIDGWTAIPALQYWYNSLPASTWPEGSAGRAAALGAEAAGARDAAPRRYWFQEAAYPCATCCSGGQS